MNSRWTWTFSAALCFGLALPAWSGQKDAEPSKGKEQQEARRKGPEKAQQRSLLPDDMVEKLTEALELNAEQATKVKAVVEQSRPNLDALQKDMKALQEKIRKELFAMKEGIRGTLTTMDQKEKFDMISASLMMRAKGMANRRMAARMGQGRMEAREEMRARQGRRLRERPNGRDEGFREDGEDDLPPPGPSPEDMDGPDDRP